MDEMVLIGESKRTAKKAHKCDCCGGQIGKGEVYTKQSFFFDGYVHWKQCSSCEEWLEYRGIANLIGPFLQYEIVDAILELCKVEDGCYTFDADRSDKGF